MSEFLQRTYYQNTVQAYLIALGIVILGAIVVKIIRSILLARLARLSQRSETHFDDYLIDSATRFGIPALYVMVIYIGTKYLTVPIKVENALRIGFTVILTILAVKLLSFAIVSLLAAYVRRQTDGPVEAKMRQLGGIKIIINVTIWALGLVFLFDNLGYDVTAVVAGLGVGGIAVALAAQNILGDLFNYFVIFFDRPFEIGDFIIVDDKLGVVEYIGIKTTRISSLWGEQLVFSNSDLTKSRIRNYKRMQKRRVVFAIRVPLETPLELVRQIPAELKSIVQEQENVTFDRAHFAAYGESSLDFEIVYYVLSPDYNVYMDVQQAINFRIFETLQKMGVEIARPGRTLWFANPLGLERNGADDEDSKAEQKAG